MLFDHRGNPIPQQYVRRAAGFVERFVSADDPDTITGVEPKGGDPHRWVRTGDDDQCHEPPCMGRRVSRRD